MLLAAGGLSSCKTQLGPRMVPGARFDYGDALVRSASEQMLLNLVRLRYRDNLSFLDITSVVTHYHAGAGASLAGRLTLDPRRGDELSASGSLAYDEEPTISFTPLQGEDFTRRLLSPVPATALVWLSQSGWSVERLFLCCVQKMNHLRNAAAAAGPTPDYVPSFAEFRRAAHLFRLLQIPGLVEVEMTEDGKDLLLHLRPGATEEQRQQLREVRTLLELDPDRASFRIVPTLSSKGADEISIVGRSMLSVLFFLSQAVEVPATDERAGLVTVTRQENGERFAWQEVVGGLLAVHSSDSPPTSAAVGVRYRGHWFYIADNDLNSKTTFSLLSYLFALKSGNLDARQPLLTLGVQ